MPEKPFEDLTIEKVRRDDLGKLEKLFTSAFADEVDIEQVKRRIRRTRQFYYILNPLSKFSLWIKNHFNIYVIKISGELVGFVQVSYINSTQMHIDYIAFSKEYRGQGLGQWVLAILFSQVADANNYDVILEVRVGNRAYNFYKRLGFREMTEILHYELRLDPAFILPQVVDLPGFRKLAVLERGKLYHLYLESVPITLRRVIRRTYGEFSPSMMVRHLEWAKNYLMRKQKQDYVVEQDGKIVAWLNVNSYFKVKSHVISLTIHPDYESLRQGLLSKAVHLIAESYGPGVISTTIYSDDPGKQVALERLGFSKDLAYYLMFRPAAAKRNDSGKSPSHPTKPLPVSSRQCKKRRYGGKD
ncbi:Acetyltransferase [uncultured Sporomusa sp.]|uniref:Acetyltransferase n=1 Tax=uncultured Sporomusa sp. TaxID=307249 RepID=A0A212LTV9_9FIRM|nr:GNAT family N-acetyltransferase [uncultured Sporomusa sp.]SCM80839.1 Acetyltransferase [uncultured Sporomusa sp.]